jgi:hypothetical protein
MNLHIFQGLDEQGNILLQYSKFCTRPKATRPYKHLMKLLESDKIHTIQVERKDIYSSL